MSEQPDFDFIAVDEDDEVTIQAGAVRNRTPQPVVGSDDGDDSDGRRASDAASPDDPDALITTADDLKAPVPFARMRIIVFVILALFVVGFILYSVFARA